jgi:hypothetical protein
MRNAAVWIERYSGFWEGWFDVLADYLEKQERKKANEGHPELTAGTSLVTVQFIPVGTATEIHLTHEQLPSIESRDHHGHGWSGTFDKLEKYLSS